MVELDLLGRLAGTVLTRAGEVLIGGGLGEYWGDTGKPGGDLGIEGLAEEHSEDKSKEGLRGVF